MDFRSPAPVLELFLRFCRVEIILWCFQTGRTNEWARAHFFVGRDIFRRLLLDERSWRFGSIAANY
jgi:hypothetical protein